MAELFSVTDLAKAFTPDCKFKIIGIRPGEKLHETLVSDDESRKTKIFNGLFVILPQFGNQNVHEKYKDYPFVPEGFVYRSDDNDKWLSVEDLWKKIEGFENEEDPLRTSIHK